MSIQQTISTAVANYPITTGVIVIGSTTIMYINNSEYIYQKAMQCAWNGMRMASRLEIWYNDMFSNCCGLWDTSDDTRFLYVVCEGRIVKSYTGSYDTISSYVGNYDLAIFRYPNSESPEKPVYKRYEETSNGFTETQSIKGLFFVANIKYGGKSYEIEDINGLTVPNTKIFDRSYVQWYMNFFYNLEIFDDDYVVELLDNNMTQIVFNHTQFVNISEHGYTMSNAHSSSTTVWRGILAEHDIPDSLPENQRTTLADISSPPLAGKRIATSERAGTPTSMVSNNTDVSFDIVDKSEAN